ncbi:MAG: glycyl-radical enzyme activating protein [Clostridia bacterium]|nr:glycyl-radical enzyme activating protein [Clostridia bacterium]
MESYMNIKGRIFDIQKYSIHDGPGIRTIVFLKGCPLRCKWCCNPEGQQFEFQQMDFAGKKKTVGEDMTVSEILTEVKKDMPYYLRSGGGLTLSGGECLCQPEFATALLYASKSAGISAAIETTGFAEWDVIKEYLKYTDYVLMDIKNIDNEKHMRFCGQSNEIILENAMRIARNHTNLTIRVPVIPTFNDTEREISAIAQFAASLPGVKNLHLLPYHRLGSDKYKGLGREYLLEDLELIPQDKMERLLAAANKFGLDCKIGG